MATAVLSLASVTKKFGELAAVSRLSLAIAPGEIYGLIGPNGSGKTTTIKMIAGLYRPTAGHIRVLDNDVVTAPTKAKRALAYVPDEPNAYDRLTGREFLAFVGELYGMQRDDRDTRIEELLARYDLSELADGPFGKCSRGTRQKLSLVAGLLHRPQLMLIDEPMVGLDPESIRVTIDVLKEYAAAGGAILVSTHTLPVAEQFCTRFGVLRGGRLIAEGDREELKRKAGLKRATLEEAFLKII